MDDLISRQAAIETVRKARDKSEAHRMLMQLPPAQPSVSKMEIVGDVISRQAAIEKLINNLTYMHTFGADRSIDLIEELPSAQPGWIPCSERCPEQSGWYLVSLKNGNVQKAWYRVAPINQGGSYWRSPIKRPLAWMPLPTPYREGGQDD